MPDMRPFANAAEAFIVHDGRVLLMRRRADDIHRPGEWDTPGGRLADGENPFTGVQREVREEVGLEVDVGQVIDVHYFTRQDGQVITMMIFSCTPKTLDVRLSDEHVEYRWVPLAEAGALVPDWLPPIVEKYQRWIRGVAV